MKLKVVFGPILPREPVPWEVRLGSVLLARGQSETYLQARTDSQWMVEFLEELAANGGLEDE